MTRARQNEVVTADLPDDILEYHRTLSPADREICHVLAAEIEVKALRRWLAASRDVQWDYEHIRTNRGLVTRTSF